MIYDIVMILAINVSKVISLEQSLVETIYDKVMLIVEGMTNSTAKEKECVNVLVKNKVNIINLSIKIIDAFKKGDNIYILIMNNLDKFTIVDLTILANHCRVLELYKLYERCMDDEKRITLIGDIGENTKHNVDLFYEGSSNFVKVRGLDGKLVLLGKIVSSFFNLTFT
mgnify:FL=1